jgi:hypothetical protein
MIVRWNLSQDTTPQKQFCGVFFCLCRVEQFQVF